MQDKLCEYCNKLIKRESSQYHKKRFCNASCRQMAHRKKKGLSARQKKRLSNLPANNEWLYIARECKRAGSVQIMSMHTVDSLEELISFIRNHPKRSLEINHVYPVKGRDRIGLLHPLNLFYGSIIQNRKAGNTCFGEAGYAIHRSELKKKWVITNDMTDKQILRSLKNLLGDVLIEYVKNHPINQSGRIKFIDSIIKLDNTGKYTRDNLSSMPSIGLSSIKAELQGFTFNDYYPSQKRNRSRVLIYIEELTRISDNASGIWAENCKFMKKIFLAGAAALSKASYQPELLNIYKLYSADAAHYKNRYLKQEDENTYTAFKTFLCFQANDCLSGKKIDEGMLRGTLSKYIEARKDSSYFCLKFINLRGCYEYFPDSL